MVRIQVNELDVRDENGKCHVTCYGVTADGRSAAVEVCGFRPRVLVRIPDNFPTGAMQSHLTQYLRIHTKHMFFVSSASVSVETIRGTNAMGFSIDRNGHRRTFKIAKVFCQSMRARRRVTKKFDTDDDGRRCGNCLLYTSDAADE